MTAKHPPLPPVRNDALIAYWKLRQMIGVLGLMMPFILPIGTRVIHGSWKLEPSISHYYYSTMHIVFMAILCMLGSFLLTYRGTSTNPRLERVVAIIAGLFAFGVAAFPTSFLGFQDAPHNQLISLQLQNHADVPAWMNNLHHVCAATLFSSFAVFCLFFFQDADTGVYDKKKKRRNILYRVCGILIVLSMLSVIWVTFVIKSWNFNNSTLVFETTALLPFGLSWLVKGSLNWPHSQNMVLRKSISFLR